MRTVVLPGWSARNKKWADEVCQFLNQNGFEAIGVDWKHWELETDQMDFKYEIERLDKLFVSNPNCSVVAKSVGTVLMALLLKDRQPKVRKLVLCGIPIKTSDEQGKAYLKGLATVEPDKVLIFQNRLDPYGPAAELKAFFQGTPILGRIQEMDRSDHDYPYFDQILKFLKN